MKQSSDSKGNLLQLRKLYEKLESKFLSERLKSKANYSGQDLPSSSDSAPFLAIIFTEAARRLAAKHLPEQAGSAQALLSLLERLSRAIERSIQCEHLLQTQKRINNSLDFERENPDLLFSLQHTLANNSDLLDKFDERFAGYFFQFASQSQRKESLKRIQKANKDLSQEDLCAFTQIFTPDWVADFLIENTALPPEPASRSNNSSLKQDQAPDQPQNLKLLDPCCGPGHILLPAFDFFHALYEKDKTKNANETLANSPGALASQILKNNIYGCDLDLSALWVCAFSLVLKVMLKTGFDRPDFPDFSLKLNLYSVSSSDDEREDESTSFAAGSLRRDWQIPHPLALSYEAVVTNPPYIGRRLMDRSCKVFLKEHYKKAKHDLSAAFLLRALELTSQRGRVGFITQSSLLSLPSYTKLREDLLNQNLLAMVVELGTGVFALQSGEKINSMLMILDKNQNSQESLFLDLSSSETKARDLRATDIKAKDIKEDGSGFQRRNHTEFKNNKRSAISYKQPQMLLKVFAGSQGLAQLVDIRQGLATSDNKRFVRHCWDIDSRELNKRWFPYTKGAGSQRWFAPVSSVIDWENNGARLKEAVKDAYPYLNGKTAWVVKNETYYFRAGLCFSFISTSRLCVRQLPAGSIFDVGASALFPESKDELFLLAYLNSAFAGLCAESINPTLNFQVGDIKELPLPNFTQKEKMQISDLGQEALACKKYIASFDERGLGYRTPDKVQDLLRSEAPATIARQILQSLKKAESELRDLETRIDQAVLEGAFSALSLTKKERLELASALNKRQQVDKLQRVDDYPSAFAGATEFAEFLLRTFLHEYQQDSPVVCLDQANPFTDSMSEPLRNFLQESLGMPLVRYISKDLNKSQLKQFSNSPQILATMVSGRLSLVFNQRLRKVVRPAALSLVAGNGETQPASGKPELFLQKMEQENALSLNYLSELRLTLAAIEDWTGSDLARILVQTKKDKMQ